MNVVVGSVAVVFLLMGVYALAAPGRVLAVFGVRVDTVDGRNEVSAVYGGYGIATSLALVLALAVPRLRPGILLATALALLGMASGRVVGALRERSPGFYPWLFFALEVVGAAALAAVVEARP